MLLRAFIFFLTVPLFSQEFRAGLTGIIRDSQGVAIAGAAIEAVNQQTNDIVRATTNETGYYSLPVLPIGIYRVSASVAGFKKAERKNLELRTGDQVQLDFTLEIGAVQETIEVTSEAELLQTSATDKGQVIDRQNVEDIPSVGRNPFLLGVVASGVQFDIGAGPLSRAVRPFDAGNNVAESMSINGGRTGASDLLLDGLSNTATETTAATNMGFVPSPAAVQQFRIQTSNYDAQYGRTSGGTISVSIKSGTNAYHGQMYEYVRNTILSANTFDQNRIGKPRSDFHQNQPGAELDGPLVLPHLYNGRNRTFFMYSYEKLLDAIPSPATSTVPTADQRAGNFNTTLQSNGQPVLIYDPLTTVQTSPTTYTRQAFPGNVIPANRISPVAAKILSYIPLPNFKTATNNLVVAPNARTDEYDAHVFRIDHNINEKQRLFSRFVRGNRSEINSDNGYVGPSSPQYADGRLNQAGNVDLTSILSPNTVLSSRVGYMRHQLWINLYSDNFDPTQLGFPQQLSTLVPHYFPQITMSSYTSFGAGRSQGDQLSYSSNWDWTETVNRTMGRHSMKFGGEFRTILDNINSPASNFGTFAFTPAFTQANPLTAAASSGNAFASFLLGLPNSGQVNYNAALAYGFHYYSGFVQDDWRITNKMTLNLGGRWDYESPVTERHNQQNAGFDFTDPSPLSVKNLNLKGGLLFTNPNHRRPYARDLNNWQPRVGFAWNMRSKMVLRAGYGLSYLATFTPGLNQGYSISTPYVATNGGPILSGNSLSNPYPEGILKPTGSSLGLGTLLGQSITFVNGGRIIPKVHQFSVGMQRELPFRTVVEAMYVGSRSVGLDVSQQINDVTAAQLAQYGTTLSNSVPNPFAGLLPGTNLNAATTTLQQTLRPYPQFTGITETNIPVGRSWYNSLQVQINKRMSHGLNFSVAYTHAKWLDAITYLNNQDSTKLTPPRTLNATDTPHRVAISGNWALPVFSKTHGVTAAFLKDWQMNGIFVRQMGFPLAAPAGYYSGGIDPSLPDSLKTESRAFNTCTLLTNGVRENCPTATEPYAFIQQQPNTLRTLSLRFPTIRPAKVPSVDVSLFKAFTLHENVKLQFRIEAFNELNAPQLGAPSTSLGTTAAGSIGLTQTNDPRNYQIAVKILF